MRISDADAGNGAVQVTLTATEGVVTLARTSGLMFAVGDGQEDRAFVFTGTIADVNAALNGMSFRCTAQTSGLQISVNDTA